MMTTDTPSQAKQQHIFTVSELNQVARDILESALPMLWLEAEISNLARPSSGHMYLTLKDSRAQIRAAMFKGRNRSLNFKPENGQQVLIKGKLTLYAPRGDYQLIIEEMEEAGLGALQRAYEKLKAKLEQEGLFDPALKKAIPEHPKSIGIVTSPTGAAIHDILTVFARRFPLTRIIIYPAAVQGEEAPAQIIRAINTANTRNETEVLIVGRGGGSLEDLWAFNDEALARTIVASKIPIVSAVGHQVDFTIADFVADLRAPTPSAAAELLSQDSTKLYQRFAELQNALLYQMEQKMLRHQQRLDWVSKRLKHPGRQLQEHMQRLDELEIRLQNAIQREVSYKKQQAQSLAARLTAQSPQHRIATNTQWISQLSERLIRQMKRNLELQSTRTAHLAHRLDSVSPLATLARGYSITRNQKGDIIDDPAQLNQGETVRVRVHKGQFDAKISEILPEQSL